MTLTDDNGQADTVNFGEFVPVAISGEVFDDLNDSGTFVSGDPGLSGWTVELVQGQQTLQTTSGSNGDYSFSNVGPGSWTLEVVQQTGLGRDEFADHHHADQRHEPHGRGPWRIPGLDDQRPGV